MSIHLDVEVYEISISRGFIIRRLKRELSTHECELLKAECF